MPPIMLLVLLSQPCNIEWGIWEEEVALTEPAISLLLVLLILPLDNDLSPVSVDSQAAIVSSQTSMGTSFVSFAVSIPVKIFG